MINLIEKDIMEDINQYKIFIVGTNVYNTMSNGFQREVALHYPYVRQLNLLTKYGDINKLGTFLTCSKENEPTFLLSYICKGYPPRPEKGKLIDYLDYSALEKILSLINILYKNQTIATTILGNSPFDGNGDRDKILNIMSAQLTDVNAFVYDYKQITRGEKLKRIRENELEVKKKDLAAYYQMVKKRKEEAEELFKKNGFARY